MGYDGTNEPTYLTRPQPNFRRAKTPQERWLARAEAAEWFLTEHKDFRTGEPDPSRSGGLKRTQEVFGEVAFIAGATNDVGNDPELVQQIGRYNHNAILAGLPEPQTYPARTIEGYRGGVAGFGSLVSQEPACPPELFWQDGILRLSDTSGPPVRVVQAHEGPEGLKAVLEGLDRSRVHVIRIQLGHPRIYMQPAFEKINPDPVRYGYDNPKLPRLPVDAVRSREEIDAAYAREEAALKWLAEQFFPENPGSRFVSSADLKRMTPSSLGSQVPREKLQQATADLLKRWNIVGNHPPMFAYVDGEYFSLADMFQMLANALAEFQRTGSLPEAVRLTHVYGPLDMTTEQGPSQGSVTVASIATGCAQLSDALKDQAWKPVPANMIPGWVRVDGIRLNAAQFMRLMAEAFLSPSPAAKLAVRTCQMFTELGYGLPNPRRSSETGATWTLKPARLERLEAVRRQP